VPQVIRVRGIRAEGRHGARAGEREEPQPFVVDLELSVEAEGDDLETTGDYREVAAAVRAVVEEESVALIETLAHRVARAVAEVPGVRSCRAVVHKPLAADRLGVADVSAEATAE
jgi:dihydroneopterin aldolase